MSHNTKPGDERREAPPLGGYTPERRYVAESEWVRGDPCKFAFYLRSTPNLKYLR